MKVFGADPGLANCGLALVEFTGSRRRLVGSALAKTSAQVPFEDRLDEIWREAFALMCHADLVGLEDQGDAWHAAGFGETEKGEAPHTNANARKVQDVLSLLRGMALALDLPRIVARPQTIRSILGVEGDGKLATGLAVRRMVSDVPAPGRISQHIVDAIAHAIVAEKKYHAVSLGLPGLEARAKPRKRVA